MKRRDHIASPLAVAALACLCAVPGASATPAKKSAARPTQPPMSGPGSLNGVWNNSDFQDSRAGPPVGAEHPIPTADGKPIPYTAAAAKIIADRREAVRQGKPKASNGAQCLTGGMPGVMRPPIELPLQIVETPDQKQITVLFEYFYTFRIIHMNEQHPADPDPGFMGNSVGHWENGTLVVDTIGLNDKTEVAGVPHSENLHLIEHMRRTSATTMEDRVTVIDPTIFTRPWTMVITLKKVPDMRIMEYVCENNRNGVLADGSTGVEVKSGQ